MQVVSCNRTHNLAILSLFAKNPKVRSFFHIFQQTQHSKKSLALKGKQPDLIKLMPVKHLQVETKVKAMHEDAMHVLTSFLTSFRGMF